MAEIAREQTTVMQTDLRRLNRWIRVLKPMGDEARGGGVEALIKALRASDTKSHAAIQRPATTRACAWDTPGVSVLDQVQQYASAQRMSIQAESAYLEMLLRTDVLPPALLLNMPFLTPQPFVVDGRVVQHSEAKDAWKRHFEAVIWALILKEKPLVGGRETRTWQVRFAHLHQHIPAKLLIYFKRRFIDPTTGRTFAEAPDLNNPSTGRTIDRTTGALANYLSYLAKAADGSGARVIVSDGAKTKDPLP